MGSATHNQLWPLIKVLDIGGAPVCPKLKGDASPAAEVCYALRARVYVYLFVLRPPDI